ncbi:MAG: hypothetical protein PUI54_02535 [Bacteroidales bacterium]|nr:hypothetical protein [Bacteroidales bacterium]
MKQDREQDSGIVLNQWNEERAEDIFYPEIVYHFKDNDGNNWIILLTWNDCYRGKEPWRAWLWRCDENWKRIDGSPDNISDLLEEKDHTPGIVKDYFYLEEYKFLEERVLEIVRELKPELKDQL